MAIEKKTLHVTRGENEYTYTVTQLDALKGRKVFVKLMNLVGPAFQFATSNAAGLGKLLSELNPDDLDFFCNLFAEGTRVTGTTYKDKNGAELTPLLSTVFGQHFAGEYLEMFEWLVFCITANYSSFFYGIEGLVKKYSPSDSAPEPAAKTTEASQ